ncbi:MAG: ubiquinol-cytochrome c reductase iron-sulfur subunit [Anaerolineales bacterium]|jgi:menaquinol-cytochrome c reductase iron-sulfur subunit
MEDQINNAENKVNRQNFLKTAIAGIGGFITIGMAIPAIAYIIGPALQQNEQEESIGLGPVSKVEIGEPTLFKVAVQRSTGWITNEEEISVYVYTENGRDFIALSNVCTHLGCRVRWITDQSEFFCPCHNGVFDKNGNVVSGPPPRPLDRYEVSVENDQLLIKVG